ncbi:MAG: carboxypeptidase M32 [Candidatus Heimdallarchaeota archaeon]|nr:MAG: carboxypeptidase M32 [Candidatus Heimdallarchaeota archaeon]RLI70973.1 MAG: carboxypeptidase M32 [Candidatus Gerdarchaeota archaeon]
MTKIPQYTKLLELYKEITLLNNINGVLYWDFEVMMPKKGTEQRSEELAYMSGLIHERNISPQIGKLLKKIQEHKSFDDLSFQQKRNVELIMRDYEKATKIPVAFAKELAKHGAISTEHWKTAKAKADFSIFRDDLAKMIELKKQEAAYLNPDGDPYDVLLDDYEYGFNKKIYDKIFAEAKSGLTPLIQSLVTATNQPDDSLILRKCPVRVQTALAHDVAAFVHYDLNAGRIDTAVHPFTTGYFDDVRITIAFDENDFTNSFFATMHEVGHALYEQNIAPEFKYQPIGKATSSAMHEGQARFIENIIGRNPAFWEFYLEKFKKITGKIFKDVQLEPFAHAINKVVPSKIRIHADPLTYSMHIILRYELEKALFADKLTVDELPSFWNEKMEEYLGIEIENDAEGILQDTHYAWGLFGYFPTYALGSYYNAQFLKVLKKDLPTWEDQLREGKIQAILDWLNKNIRRVGKLYDPLDLVKRVTGEDFTAKYFVEEVKNKYTKLYGL